MSAARFSRLLCILCFVWVMIFMCEGITNYKEDEKNLIAEDERRGVDLKKDVAANGQKKSQTHKRGLWIVNQANREPYPSYPEPYPAGYDFVGTGERYPGYSESGGYGTTGSGYTVDTGDPPGGYYQRPVFETGYGHSGSGSHFGYSATGAGFGHSGNGGNFGQAGGGVEFSHNGGHGEHGSATYGSSYGHDDHKKLALKKILIPLAGLAILGAAAALSSHPVLLQLGTVSGRRKRSILKNNDRNVFPANPWIKPDFIN